MSDWGYVLASYGLTWAVLAGYALYLRTRTKRAAAAAETAPAASERPLDETPAEVAR